jgi:hypothetical protein
MWLVRLGEIYNGIEAEAVVGTLLEAVEWLRATAVKLHPDSTFARKYARGFK